MILSTLNLVQFSLTTVAKPITAVQGLLPPGEVALATSQIFFSQYLGAAIFISLGETIFSNTLRTALKSGALDVDVNAIIAGGPTKVRFIVSPSDLPGVLQAYNHAITTTYVSYSLKRSVRPFLTL